MTQEPDVTYKYSFFISYAQADRDWAEWIAWFLEEDGHRVLIRDWDSVPGSNWIQDMTDGIQFAARTIAVLSHSYLDSVYGSAEWQSVFATDPDGSKRRLLVVRAQDCQGPTLLNRLTPVDLFGRSEEDAKETLRAMVEAAENGRVKPKIAPRYPGDARAVPEEPSFPGDEPHGTGSDTQERDQANESTPVGEETGPKESGQSKQAVAIGKASPIVVAALVVVAAVIFVVLSSKGSPTPPEPGGKLVVLASPGVHAVAYSADGNFLAAAGADGAVRVWRTDTWQSTPKMVDPDAESVSSVAFNPANTLLAAGDAKGHVYIWRRYLSRTLRDLSRSAIRSVAFSRDNKYLVAGDASGAVTVWQTRTWHRVGTTHPSATAINSVAFSPANSLMAASDTSGRVYIYADASASGTHEVITDPSGAAIRSILFTTDGVALIGGDGSGHVYVWHVGSPKAIEHLADPSTKGVSSVSFDSSTQNIVAADGNGKVYLWFFGKKPKRIFRYPADGALLSVSYSPDGNHLAVASANGKVYVRVVNSRPAVNIYSPLGAPMETKAFGVTGTASNIPPADRLWLIVRAPNKLWYAVDPLRVAAQKWNVAATSLCIQPGHQDVQVWMVPTSAEAPLARQISHGRDASGIHSLPPGSVLKAHVTVQVPLSVKSTCG